MDLDSVGTSYLEDFNWKELRRKCPADTKEDYNVIGLENQLQFYLS